MPFRPPTFKTQNASQDFGVLSPIALDQTQLV